MKILKNIFTETSISSLATPISNMSDKQHSISEKDLELAVKALHQEIRMSFGEDRANPMKELLVHHLIL